MNKMLSILLAILVLLSCGLPAALAADMEEPVYLCKKATCKNSDGSTSVEEHTYDADGRRIKTVAIYRQPDGFFCEETTECTFDEKGNETRETFSSKSYSGNQKEPSAFSFTDNTYAYDEKGNLVQTTYIYKDSGGENRKLDYTLTYDEQGRVLKEVCDSNEGKTEVWTNTYDEKGNLTKETYACGENKSTAVSTYNKSGNLTKSVRTYRIDGEKGKSVDTYAYDRKGNLIKEKSWSVDSSGFFDKSVETYVYDSKGHVIREAYSYAGLYGVGREVIRYKYNKAGQLTAETRKCMDTSEVSTYNVRYTYNKNGDPAKEVMVYVGTYGVLGKYVKTYAYDENRNLTAETETYMGLTGTDETAHTYAFDSAGRTVRDEMTLISKGPLFSSETAEINAYAYDAHGNLTQKVNEYRFDDEISSHVWTYEYQAFGA